MRVLEARFHPGPRDSVPALIVGHVIWPDERDRAPTIHLSPELAGGASPENLLSKLRYLVSVTAPDSFLRLQDLHSVYWSFLDVSGSPPP